MALTCAISLSRHQQTFQPRIFVSQIVDKRDQPGTNINIRSTSTPLESRFHDYLKSSLVRVLGETAVAARCGPVGAPLQQTDDPGKVI